MGKFKDAAIVVLKEAGTPLHYKEIVRLAIEKRILETGGKSPDATMNAEIVVDINKKGVASDFVKTGPGTYALNPNKSVVKPVPQPVARPKIKAGKPVKTPDGKKSKSEYTGKGGEYLVCSELLFREYNASIMSVDTGVDIVATKDNKLFGIQVKTATLSKNNTYIFDIRKTSFQNAAAGNIFYVFVIHDRQKISSTFIVLPYHHVNQYISENAISTIINGERYRLTVKVHDGKFYTVSKNKDLSYFVNNWNIV